MTFHETHWILIDTETTGFTHPIWPVEIGAQRMRGYNPVGPPMSWLLNHGIDIPPDASRIHGYTREILERHGMPRDEALSQFETYCNGAPLAAYNLDYDYLRVLAPFYIRCDRQLPSQPAFCLAGLTRGLLPGKPAGNYQLQTLAQYYRLPNNGAHTALGDIYTSQHLLNLIRPLAIAAGLDTLKALADFAAKHPPLRRR